MRTLATTTSAALWLLAALSTSASAQTYYPGCPHWSHSVTFVNNSSNSVQIKETDGCYSNNMAPPYTGKCWPQQISGGSLTLAPAGQPKSSQTVSIVSCWSGNFSIASATFPYQTLAEFTFDGGLNNSQNPPAKINSNNDNYDVSMVDGFTTALLITPSLKSCKVAGCSKQPVCPAKLVYQGGCLSPNTYVRNVMPNPTEADKDKYGCICSSTQQLTCTAGPNNSVTPAGCVGKYGCSPFSPPGAAGNGPANPGSACCPWYKISGQPCSASTVARAWEPWAQQYIANVHAACPNQYAWQYDDNQGGFACPSAEAATSYTITVPAASTARKSPPAKNRPSKTSAR
ncbi:MAG: hypothetical protein WAM82_11750 [Thermoanaerobaculia bacterium]